MEYILDDALIPSSLSTTITEIEKVPSTFSNIGARTITILVVWNNCGIRRMVLLESIDVLGAGDRAKTVADQVLHGGNVNKPNNVSSAMQRTLHFLSWSSVNNASASFFSFL